MPTSANIEIPSDEHLFEGQTLSLRLGRGVTTFVGPNGAGKTRTLRALRSGLAELVRAEGRKMRYLAAGRSSPLENFRAAVNNPVSYFSPGQTAYVGHTQHKKLWFQYESVTGDYLALEQRADLRLKVQARLQAFLSRSIEFRWGQSGLEVYLAPLARGDPYSATDEASGVLHLIALLAAVYNEEIGALLIDEPEISLHPQYQAFLLDEICAVAGDPRSDKAKKFVVVATHSPTMLGVRNIADLPNLVLFTDQKTLPVQIFEDAEELNSTKLAALVARLTATHRLAFFASQVLLVEGPSDEIIAAQLAKKLQHPLMASNTQVVPMTGKGGLAGAIKLFELMGKRTTVLADLDALADDTSLINQFNSKEACRTRAEVAGHASLRKLDGDLRNDFAEAVATAWSDIESAVQHHHYWATCPEEKRDDATKRRATLAVLMSGELHLADKTNIGTFERLRNRSVALFEVLEAAGCFVLRRGTIENYFGSRAEGVSKPDEAAAEAASFAARTPEDIESAYADVLRALRHAAPVRAVDENGLLAEQLGAVLGAAFEALQYKMDNDELNNRVRGILADEASVFWLENISTAIEKRLRVSIKSPLFEGKTFPFDISIKEDRSRTIADKLPRL